MNIGKLQEVDIRKLWKHEQYDFSDWLAKEENIMLLNEILGLTLVDVSKEVYVGIYRCDLVAVDESLGTKVIIENQLEQSNHDHLGKIITYASGLDAEVIVWIVKNAKEEHRSAIEWLNNNTNSKINFFLIELKAYTMDNITAAPFFNVIEKPNDFLKNTKVNYNSDNLNKSQSERLEFWNRFNEIIIERGKPFNIRKATTNNWYDVTIGTSGVYVTISLINRDSIICVEVYIRNNKELFDKLYERKLIIENELGFSLDWDRANDNKASRIRYNIKGLNFDNHSNYDALMNTTIDVAVKLRDVFKKHI